MTTPQRRNILLYSPLSHSGAQLRDLLGRQRWIEARPIDRGWLLAGRGLDLRVDVVTTLEAAVDRLHADYYSLMVVDVRDIPHDSSAADPRRAEALDALFAALRDERDGERRYPRSRIVVLVGGEDAERVDELVFALGQRHIGGCVRDRSLSRPAPAADRRDEVESRFVEALWSRCHAILEAPRGGKKAINAAAGGITGIYYQLGVLKCLHDSLSIDVRDFDLFAGVSGGAMVAACLANGIGLDEMIAKLGSLDRTWNFRLRLSWRHLNVGAAVPRLRLTARELAKYARRMLAGQDDFSFASLLGIYAALPGPLFDGAEFEQALRELFEQPGRSNDFRRLRAELLIGATDQDRREHVLFGEPGLRHVPISRAIQASSAWHPFFAAVEIDGRFYTDGIVTRTSNLGASLAHGADLVFVVDPFVPLIAERPGENARHGNMWVAEQDYKTMSYTRFEQARDELVRRNSHAAVYTFVPSNRMRRLMSGQNAFVSRNFHPIVCEAYQSTCRRLRTLEYRIRGDLAAHQIELDLAPVERRVERLAGLRRPDVRVLLDGQ